MTLDDDTAVETDQSYEHDHHQMIGVVLAMGGNLIISIALNLTKHAHNINQLRDVPLPYTGMPLWWCGLACTILGEIGNFAAYGFADASLVAPLGAVAVLANAFIAVLFLGEGFRMIDVAGCALCISGGVIIVSSTPSHETALDPEGFVLSLRATPFLVYIAVLSATVAVMLALQERYGDCHVAYYVLLCSLLGSITVICTKGVSTFVNLWLCCGAPSPFGVPIMYALCLVLGSTAILQVGYLNKAMERFGNTETVPVYYVLFTLTTISGSNVLFRDFEQEDRCHRRRPAAASAVTATSAASAADAASAASAASAISANERRHSPWPPLQPLPLLPMFLAAAAALLSHRDPSARWWGAQLDDCLL